MILRNYFAKESCFECCVYLIDSKSLYLVIIFRSYIDRKLTLLTYVSYMETLPPFSSPADRCHTCYILAVNMPIIDYSATSKGKVHVICCAFSLSIR